MDWSRLVLALTAWALQVSLGLRYLNFGGPKDMSFFRTWFPDLGDGASRNALGPVIFLVVDTLY